MKKDKVETIVEPTPPVHSRPQDDLDFTAPPPTEPTTDPPPELIDALVRHYTNKRADLERQIGQMEALLGFIEVSSNLAVRVARLEQFLGVKG